MKAIIKINMNNASFLEGQPYNNQLSACLKKLAEKVEEYENNGISVDTIAILDSNGNRVGELEIQP